MTQVWITAISVLVPAVALVFITRQFFLYRAARAAVDGRQSAEYRELAAQAQDSAARTTAALQEVERRLHGIETVLRSVE